jgi:alpha-beta hydrolase superfamily lysophospholipase
MKIVETHQRIDGVPVIEFYPADAERKLPVILILHGFSGRKEDNFMTAYHLAEQGYYAVSIDLYLHGELGALPFIPADVSPRLLEILAESKNNISRLVEAYKDHLLADGEHIGLMGISLGGAVIHAYLPHRSGSLKAAVAMIAGLPPFFDVTFRSVQTLFPHFGVTDEWIEALAQQAQSAPFLDNLSDFPLLWLYGQADPIIPIERVREVFLAVQHRYTRPGLMELVEYENCGHETPAEMYSHGLEWFRKFL